MNTKKYLALFGSMAEKGEIPRELYDLLVAEIAADKGKMTKRVYALFLDELEKRGLFDADGAPFDTKNSARTDGNYVYERPKNPFWRLAHFFWSTVFKFVGYVGGGIVFGVWRVKDRKKLKKLGACITLSNHVGYLDAVLTVRARGMRCQYIIVAPHNCKHNLGGHILKMGGEIPLPTSIQGTRVFNSRLEHVARKNAAIHVYPEQSMWIGYKKPRPYKDGAFMFADKLDIPVVPMLYCFKQPRGLRKLLHLKKAVIKIGEPLYADKSLPVKQRRDELKARAESSAKALYASFYGAPPTYSTITEEQTDETLTDKPITEE